MRRHVLLSEAVNEIAEAFQWYEFRSAGLGRRFVDAVTGVVEIACETPAIFPAAQDNTRRARVLGFPFSVYFAVELDVVLVYAVFHERRNPAARGGRRR